MQVNSLLIIVNKLVAVLELYRGSSVEEMLDDIYQLYSVRSTGTISKKETGRQKQSKRADELPPEEAVVLLPGVPEEQRRKFLVDYYIRELEVIASLQGVRLPSKANKNEIINIIIKHSEHPVLMLEDKQSEPVGQKSVVEITGELSQMEDSQRGERLRKAATAIQEMNEEEIMQLLNTFNKSEILEIARRNNFKISSSNNKDNIIIMLAKNLGFKDLNRRISQRSHQ